MVLKIFGCVAAIAATARVVFEFSSGPSSRLKDYVLARHYLELQKNKNQIAFKRKYAKNSARLWRKAFWILVYFIASVIALSPFLVIGVFKLHPKYYVFLLVTLPAFGFFAVDALRLVVKLRRAEELVKSQRKHTSLISLKK